MSAQPVRKVRETLDRFSSKFSDFVDAFNDGQYVLWLGSGISRDRVPNVSELLERVVEHLRSRIVDSDPECEYRSGLQQILKLAGLSVTEIAEMDFSVPVQSWPIKHRIFSTLVTNYSRVLDVNMGDKHPEDYLVWNGLDVPNTYGSPEIKPDVEHYAIAVLMLEGLVDSAVTANWDGLLEKALSDLAVAFQLQVRVAIKPDDFRNTSANIDIIKFHGCAVRARENEAEYRQLLTARESQISGWTEQPEHRSMLRHLEALYTDRPTLMIGLSAQDANLHTLFAKSYQTLPRSWPCSPPAVLLSEEQIETYHTNLLRLTYGESYPGNSTAISEASLLGSYGKPTLLALVLITLTDKFIFLLEQNPMDALSQVSIDAFKGDLLAFRNFLATRADPIGRGASENCVINNFQQNFILRLIDVLNLALTIFRTGDMTVAPRGPYVPLSDRPIKNAILNPDFPTDQFSRLSVVLALIGRGIASGQLTIDPGDSGSPERGTIRLTAGGRQTCVFFVKDAHTLTILELSECLDKDDPDVLIVVADEEPPIRTRSPRSQYGRNGTLSNGKFNIAGSINKAASVEELHEAFNLAGGF